MTMILMAALIPMLKMLAYIAPAAGVVFGEAYILTQDEKFDHIQVTDLGTSSYDDLLLDIPS